MSKSSSYKYAQIFGYKGPNQRVQEEDIITSLKFDHSGKYLALGDRAGRVILFENTVSSKSSKKNDQFDYYAQFQSHDKGFDCLRSMQIDESVVDIQWLRNQGVYQKLLTTNSRTIKHWKIYENQEKKIIKSCGNNLEMPKLAAEQKNFVAHTQDIFPSRHQTDIKHLSCSTNQLFLLSFDQVQGFMWDMEKKQKPFMVLDLKGSQQLEEIKENITCGKFQTKSDNIFAYGTDKGTVSLSDMRVSTQQQKNQVKFNYEVTGAKNFFSQYVAQVSSLQFMKNGKYLAARDFMNIRVWDICNPKKPIASIPIQEGYKSKLCEMFESDAIFDKFPLTSSSDGTTLLTGSYNNTFHLFDVIDCSNTQYQLSYKKATITKPIPLKGVPVGKVDYLRKVVASDFSPKSNVLAVASLNSFFIYSI